MPTKPYEIPEAEPVLVCEPAVAYLRRDAARHAYTTGRRGPNAMFIGTQDEFIEHIHRIEQGEFMTIEEADKQFEEWRIAYLANRI